jgi:ABC-type dipeptide/oligopeptide/nickel transport system permease component
VRRLFVARLIQSLIVVLIVTTISFFVIRSAPGDPFSYDSANITPAIREHWRAQRGCPSGKSSGVTRYARRSRQG